MRDANFINWNECTDSRMQTAGSDDVAGSEGWRFIFPQLRNDTPRHWSCDGMRADEDGLWVQQRRAELAVCVTSRNSEQNRLRHSHRVAATRCAIVASIWRDRMVSFSWKNSRNFLVLKAILIM